MQAKISQVAPTNITNKIHFSKFPWGKKKKKRKQAVLDKLTKTWHHHHQPLDTWQWQLFPSAHTPARSSASSAAWPPRPQGRHSPSSTLANRTKPYSTRTPQLNFPTLRPTTCGMGCPRAKPSRATWRSPSSSS